MESLHGRLPQTMVSNLKMEASYKMDEGYSEDTRSQDGSDSPMAMESGSDNLLHSRIMSATGLSAAVLAFSEVEKAGIFTNSFPLRVRKEPC